MAERDDSSPEQLATITALVSMHAAARQHVTQGVISQILAILRPFTGWYDPAEVRDLANDMAGWVRAGQETVAELTQSYLTEVLDTLDAAPRIARVVELPDRIRDVDPITEWSRPAAQYRYRLSITDTTPERAKEFAETRAKEMADMDLGLAVREASKRTLASADKVIGFRRIIHPELSTSGTCGLCVVAADRIYHRSELLPLHNGCRCTVAPITRTFDPGLTLNRDDLNALYRGAGGTDRARLQRTRVIVKDHGELGPILTYGDHAFRGPAAAAELAA